MGASPQIPSATRIACDHCGVMVSIDSEEMGGAISCFHCGLTFTPDPRNVIRDGQEETISTRPAIVLGPDLSGRQLGNFLLQRIIGQGAAGAVYLAEDVMLKRSVAVKVLPVDSITRDPVTVKRFMQEAQLAAQLNHPHVVQIYYVSQAEGHYFIAMEYVDGGNLDQWVHKHGPPDSVKGAAWMSQACLALRLAHGHGVVHRDVKPANLMLSHDGRIKVADFGLAKLSGSAEGLTQTRRMVGTPQYMSPEQCRGAEATERSDLYGLGATFFYVMTGRPPYPADSIVGVAYKHVHEPVPDPRQYRPDLDASLADVIMRCMAKQPEQRFGDAGEIIKILSKGPRELSLEAPAAAATGLSALEAEITSPREGRRSGLALLSESLTESLEDRYEAVFGSMTFAFAGPPAAGGEFVWSGFAKALGELLGHLRDGTSLIGLVGQPGSGRSSMVEVLAGRAVRTHRVLPLTGSGSSAGQALARLTAMLGIKTEPSTTDEHRQSHIRAQFERMMGTNERIVGVIDDEIGLQASAAQQLQSMLQTACSVEGLQLILIGKPDLPVQLAVSNALPDGVFGSAIVTLDPMGPEEMNEYISHRLRAAGSDPDCLQLTPAARELIYIESGGLPANINRICHNTMVLCCRAETPRATMAMVFEAARHAEFVLDVRSMRDVAGNTYGGWENSVLPAKFSRHATLLRTLASAL